ncbi:unnamed protein product, partial [Rotaria magnacalcarata]
MFRIPECRLGDDFQSLLDNPVYSDVTLVCGHKEFPVHKAILSARSKVFQAMFEHKMLENERARVEIEDIDGDIIFEILRFIYADNVADILILADLHSAAQLRQQSIDFINTHPQDVLETIGFQLMIRTHPHLLADAYRAMA